MNNLNFRAFKPAKTSSYLGSICFGNCSTQIQKVLPFWIANQPFWTYQCLCCHTYQFESGKTGPEWGGVYD